MKQLANKVLTNLFSYYHKHKLPLYSGNFFVSPKPPYLSQFVGIYPSSIKVNDSLTNKADMKTYGAKNSEEFTFWAWRNCGIVCVKMLLAAKNLAKNKSVMDLTHEGVKHGGYITYIKGKLIDKGWFHSSLVSLMNQYGVHATIKKWQSPESVARDILNNKLVILSVIVPGRSHIKEDGSFDAKEKARYGGHLFLATGVKMNGKKVEGLYVHDPRGLKNYQKNTWVPGEVLRRIFTNRTIVAS